PDRGGGADDDPRREALDAARREGPCEGTNQATWLLMVPHLTLLALVAVLWDVRLIPVVGLVALVTVLAWRSRGRLPEALRGLRELLGEGEEVLGDGVGTTRGALTRSDAVRLVVTTDRRVLVTRVSRSGAPLVLVDAPYREVIRFGIGWR